MNDHSNINSQALLENFSTWFRTKIVPNHIKNTRALANIKKFNINAFLLPYLTHFLEGNVTSEGLAKALIYPRALSSSITTTFGTEMQNFIANEPLLDAEGSAGSGIDIEFTDQIDGRRKYAQLKAGPNTINSSDVKTIIDHFKSLKNLLRTNGKRIYDDDLIVGVLYGSKEELSGSYRKIDTEFPVIIGEEFWHRLTGDKNFYNKLLQTFIYSSLPDEERHVLEETIKQLAKNQELIDLAKRANKT